MWNEILAATIVIVGIIFLWGVVKKMIFKNPEIHGKGGFGPGGRNA